MLVGPHAGHLVDGERAEYSIRPQTLTPSGVALSLRRSSVGLASVKRWRRDAHGAGIVLGSYLIRPHKETSCWGSRRWTS